MGKMTDVNIWNYSMSKEKMQNWTTCVNDESGNVINWKTAEWSMKGLKKEELTTKDVCQPENTLSILTFALKTFEESAKFCNLI